LATDNNKIKKYGSLDDIFILCETCYWCVPHILINLDYLEKCPMCLNEEMSSFLPILPNEAFTFNYNDKRGVELEFRPRKKKKEQE
jgi:hypothetical protein